MDHFIGAELPTFCHEALLESHRRFWSSIGNADQEEQTSFIGESNGRCIGFGRAVEHGPVCAAQCALGIDVSAYQGNISAGNWTTLHTTNNRDFVFIRSSRGGTTGEDHRQGGYPSGNNTYYNLSERYDDPYFVQNINRATAAGLFAGSYHFSRPDVIASTPNSGGIPNNGTDEANHFIQMAGAFMRPGYLPPVHDFEAGDGLRTDDEMAQFCIDFSNRIYEVMGIRPAIYSNGNYAAYVIGEASASLQNEVVSDYPTLWSARWPNQGDPNYIPAPTENPSDSFAPIYGPWDDAPNPAQPWSFWQYSSRQRLSGYANGGANIDADIANGGIEFVKNNLIPALWMNDSSGDWSTLANWNSGQTPIAPVSSPGQLTPIGTQTLPTPRLPGAAGSGPTAGSNDTVILDRPNANITVTLSSGTHNIRKLFAREALNITGGSLTINYDPAVDPAAGLIAAQFSAAVSLSGTGNLSVNSLQVDNSRTFTLGGGTLTFKQINLMPHSTTPAKIAVTGDVNINPLSNGTATIANGSGAGNTGFVDLGGGIRGFNIGNGGADVDLDVAVPITNGGLTKSGAGTMRLSGNNTFSGAVTINGGVLRYNHSSGLQASTLVTVNNGGTLDMNGITDTISALASAAGNTTGTVTQGAASMALSANSGAFDFGGTITGSGTLTKSGAATQILSGNSSLGPVNITAGKMLFNGASTTGNVTVSTNGILGGTGSVSGTVIVNNTGHIAPGASIESLGVGALTLNTGSVLDFELGAGGAIDLINVTGLLNIAGSSTVNLADLGGMAPGLYTLIDYGTISGGVASLGTPSGPSNFKYGLIDTGSAINLLVSLFGDFNFDNKVDGADYAVWRNGLGTTYTQTDYNDWRAHFGEVAGSGSALGSGAVPEPATAILLLGGLLPFVARRRHRLERPIAATPCGTHSPIAQ